MRKVLSRDGTAIAFDQSGQGPALILVGGATCTGYLVHPFEKIPKIVLTVPVLRNLLTSQVMIWF